MKTLLLTTPAFKILSIPLDVYEAHTLEMMVRIKVLYFTTELRNAITEGEERLDSVYWSKTINGLKRELTNYQSILRKLEQ